MADIDSTQAILTLLSSNWNNANTDSITPQFKKIFQVSKTDMDFNTSKDYVLAYNSTTSNEEIGIGGTSTEHVNETIVLDLRSIGSESATYGLTDDTHVRKVRLEIDRIVKNKKSNPDSNFNLLSSTQNWQEMNDRYRGIFRYIKTLQLTQYCRTY